MDNVKVRESNMELLRIVAMLMIVVYHTFIIDCNIIKIQNQYLHH